MTHARGHKRKRSADCLNWDCGCSRMSIQPASLEIVVEDFAHAEQPAYGTLPYSTRNEKRQQLLKSGSTATWSTSANRSICMQCDTVSRSAQGWLHCHISMRPGPFGSSMLVPTKYNCRSMASPLAWQFEMKLENKMRNEDSSCFLLPVLPRKTSLPWIAFVSVERRDVPFQGSLSRVLSAGLNASSGPCAD